MSDRIEFGPPRSVASADRRLLLVFDGGDAPGYSSVAVALTEEGTRRGYEVWAAAAGFRIAPDQIDAFRERFCPFGAGQYPGEPPAPSLRIDAEVPLSAVTLGLIKDLARLEPQACPYGDGFTATRVAQLLADPAVLRLIRPAEPDFVGKPGPA